MLVQAKAFLELLDGMCEVSEWLPEDKAVYDNFAEAVKTAESKMSVQTLIAELNKVQDKSREVAFCILSSIKSIDCQESPDGPVLLYTE